MPVDLKSLCPKLINQVLDTIFVVDESGIIVFINDACEQLLGYTAVEMIGTPIVNYIHPDDRDHTLKAARQVMSGQPHRHFENRYRHKDGGVVHILWSARWSEEDRLRIAVARDVTTLRLADQTRNALYRISEAAHAADTLRALCDGVRQVIGELFPGDELYLAFYDPTTAMLSVPDWSSDHPSGWIKQSIETGTALADVLLSGKAVLTSRNRNYHQSEFKNLQSERDDWLGVPLIAGDTVSGAVVVTSESNGRHYCDTDQELLQFIATQVANMVVRKQAEEALRFLAHHDPLTGLTNRALFYDRLEMALRSASRSKRRLALLYLDLNDFKRINDTWGHEAGDRVLTEMARRLEQGTRETDTVGRMGGDEFTVVLTDTGEVLSVETAVEKIREILAAPMAFSGQEFHIRCSIGVALYPDDGATARELLNKADANMYVNKHGG